MNFSKLLLWAGALTFAVSSIGYSFDDGGAAERGPCYRASTAWAPVPPCEPSCSIVCWDQYSPVVVTPGRCAGYSGACTLWNAITAKYIWVDCDCPFLGGHCITNPPANYGTQWLIDCTTASDDA